MRISWLTTAHSLPTALYSPAFSNFILNRVGHSSPPGGNYSQGYKNSDQTNLLLGWVERDRGWDCVWSRAQTTPWMTYKALRRTLFTSCVHPPAHLYDLWTWLWRTDRPSSTPPPLFCLLYSFYKRFISSRSLRNVPPLALAFCLGRGLTVMNNKGWPLAEPRLHLLLPPVWQHDTKAVWHVYTFQAEPLFRGGCSLCVMGPLQTKPASFLIKSKWKTDPAYIFREPSLGTSKTP